ncbi:Noc2-domain-containing protein [Fistulina hepatica ATCC 64428]|uniref:Noc2-domain-containing protein n=1 Tax=Fistulina hepatica ATCC 64428 TaxID=1128425 RepID=A0A0D7AF40_9AGAR|nr:Noc2-domain-containing protein [Fistulina hepatica ATCC 64428]
MGKVSKSFKKFAASGKLKKTIQARRKHKETVKKINSRKAGKARPDAAHADEDEDVNDEDVSEQGDVPRNKGMSVDEFLSGGFMNMDVDGAEENAESQDEEDAEQDEDNDDDDAASFASVDDLEDEGEAHFMELSNLAEKDPEFYKYLQENDRELLEFDPSADDIEIDSDEEGADKEEMEAPTIPPLTKKIIREWQKSLLEHRSLRSLRKLLLAFRSAVHSKQDDRNSIWSIESSSVYDKLVSTTLTYTPMVLQHHIPYKSLPDGKFKPPPQSPKFKALQKMILSYFYNVVHLLSQLSDEDQLRLALTESAKIIPYVLSGRKAVKLYLKQCLQLWSATTSSDNTRVAAFMAVMQLATSTDEAVLDTVLKSTYLSLVRSCKSTNAHTLPAINLMKNTASEVFCLDHTASYQHAFGYIRQLAIHLRNSMKVKTKESYKQVYNWQYVHCIDFWCIVLARTCQDEDGELRALIYPLVQVSLGAIRLMTNSRSYPFHLHVLRSLVHLTQRTRTFIPLAPYIVPILVNTLGISKAKPSTLKPLDLEVQIRAPHQYLNTRVYTEGVVEEAAHLLVEWLAAPAVLGSIAFPEVVVPVRVALRKALKKCHSAKDAAGVKTLLERVEESARVIEQRRAGVTFAPANMERVADWERELAQKMGELPISKYAVLQRRKLEQRRKMARKAMEGDAEIIDQ